MLKYAFSTQSDRSQIRGRGKTVAIGLYSFTGESWGERETGESLAVPCGLVGLRCFAHGRLLVRSSCEEVGCSDILLCLARRSLGLLSLALADWQGDIDILEDLARGDGENTFGGFDKIVAPDSGVLTAENIGEVEAGVKLFGFDQKASAIGNP